MPANVTPFARLRAASWQLELPTGDVCELRRLGADLDPQFEAFLADRPTVGAGLMLSAPAGADTWRRQIRSARRIALAAELDGTTMACVSVVRRYLTWMRHLAEIDVLVAGSAAEHLAEQHPTDRCLQILASSMLREILRVTPDLAVAKLIARVPRSIALHPHWLLEAGFLPVATLADWIELEPGRTSDLDLFTLETTVDSADDGTARTSPGN